MNRPVVPEPLETGITGAFDRLLLLREDGTVAWESPEGWAQGAHLESFLHPARRRVLEESIDTVVSGRAPRRHFECDVVGPDGTWKPAMVEIGVAPPEWPGLLLVTVREQYEGPSPADLAMRATRDSLTALPNRDAVLNRLRAGEESADRETLAVFYIDVDHFKRINDRLGHGGGDAVLLAVADRLRAAVRPGDVVSRFGGDEFVVVAGGLAEAGVASIVGERIRNGVRSPMRVDGRTVNVTVSIGVTVGDNSAGQQLLDQADTALYRAKEGGRDRVEAFQEGDRIRRSRQVQTETVLSDALDADSLAVAYQPIVDLASGGTAMMRVSLRARRVERGTGNEAGHEGGRDAPGEGREGFERGRRVVDLGSLEAEQAEDAHRHGRGGAAEPHGDDHPRGELERPDDLMRLAEESGLIVSLGAGVLDEACSAASSWPSGEDGSPAVGLVWTMTTRQLEEPRSADQVLATLRARQMPGPWLTVEVAEESLLHPGPAVRRTVDQLHAGGVRLMLAGFGGGAGGLGLLRDFPIDAVTLDRVFVQDLDEDSRQVQMLTAILAFGRLLGVDIAVQGVSTEAQATMLRALGCRWASGPLFGTPAPAGALLRRFH